MIDVSDQGVVYNPKTQGRDGSVGDQNDAVSGVVKLQIAGTKIFGSRDSRSFEHFADQPVVDGYFVLDTLSGTHTNFGDEAALREEALRSGTRLNLEPISNLYNRYRFTWFDGLAGLLLILPILLGIGLLFREAIRLRRSVTA
jgi:hypothetical protein